MTHVRPFPRTHGRGKARSARREPLMGRPAIPQEVQPRASKLSLARGTSCALGVDPGRIYVDHRLTGTVRTAAALPPTAQVPGRKRTTDESACTPGHVAAPLGVVG